MKDFYVIVGLAFSVVLGLLVFTTMRDSNLNPHYENYGQVK